MEDESKIFLEFLNVTKCNKNVCKRAKMQPTYDACKNENKEEIAHSKLKSKHFPQCLGERQST